MHGQVYEDLYLRPTLPQEGHFPISVAGDDPIVDVVQPRRLHYGGDCVIRFVDILRLVNLKQTRDSPIVTYLTLIYNYTYGIQNGESFGIDNIDISIFGSENYARY